MDNPETLATLGTQDAGRRQTLHKNKTQKIKKMSNTNHTGGEPRFSGRVKLFMPRTRHTSCYSYSQYVLNTTIHKHSVLCVFVY